MQNLVKMLNEIIDENLQFMIISHSRHKEQISKVKIRPLMLKSGLMFQTTEYRGTQVFHANHQKNELISYIENMLISHFSQLEILTADKKITALVNKHARASIKVNQLTNCANKQMLAHNRTKNYIVKEGEPVPFMVDLGVMTKEGKIVKAKWDKFRQINRFLEYIEDILGSLSKEREVRILDFGCGKSYLTFAMYYYLKELKGYDVRITGLDLKKEVIAHCNELAKKYGYEKLEFLCGDIAEYEGVNRVDMVVTLHACDTATDYALYKAINWDASVILSVPCCQHELNGQINNDFMNPVLKYGLIKERMSALMTDAIRANLLEMSGYDVQILEFIDMEHTPKNILLRCVKRTKDKAVDVRAINRLMEEYHISPTLFKLLRGDALIHS